MLGSDGERRYTPAGAKVDFRRNEHRTGRMVRICRRVKKKTNLLWTIPTYRMGMVENKVGAGGDYSEESRWRRTGVTTRPVTFSCSLPPGTTAPE